MKYLWGSDFRSGSKKRKWPCLIGMSVLPSRADLVRPPRHVRFVPTGDSCTAAITGFIRFDHLVGARLVRQQGNPVRAQIASRAIIIRSTSDARRRCSGETGLERPQSSQIRRSLKGHGTPDVCALRPHIVSSCSDQRTCLLESRSADQ
jgi:hypothetical protein